MFRTLNAILLAVMLGMSATSTADDTTATLDESVAVKGDVAAAVQAWTLIENGALLIDVRSPAEFQSGHIEGAINIPHMDIDALASAIGEDHSRAVVLYCGSGRRAGLSQDLLEELGYDGIFNATGFSALQATQP